MSRPHTICQRCYDEQQASWISQFLMHCPHFRTLARRRSKSDTWTIDRGVTAERARKHVEAAAAKMAAYSAKRGMTVDEALALQQRLFEHERAAEKKAQPENPAGP